MAAKKKRKPRMKMVSPKSDLVPDTGVLHPLAEWKRRTFVVQVMIYRGKSRRVLEDSWFETVTAVSTAMAIEMATEAAEDYIYDALPVRSTFGVQIGSVTEQGVDDDDLFPAEAPAANPLGWLAESKVAKPPVFKKFECPIIKLCAKSEVLGNPRTSVRLD